MSLRRPRKRPGATHPAVLRLGDLSREQRRVLAAASQVLKEHGARGYLVGGLIRDYLRGEKTDDIDLVVAGIEPAAVAGHISRLLGFSRPVVFPRFKTVLVVGAGLRIETCRLQGDLGPDAMLRDFTANCLYADLRRVGRGGDRVGLLDPTGVGLTDLKAGLLRTPSDPCFTMWLDPLRILRAIRFYAVGGFRLDGGLVAALDRTAYLLAGVAAERTRVELEKILVSGRLQSALRLMQRTGALDAVMPEVGRTHGFCQATPYHAYDLFTHLVKTAAGTPPEVPLRLAGLLHDIGKVATQAAGPGRMVYYGHEQVSARDTVSIMQRLKFSKRAVDLVSFLVGNHMINYSRAWGDKAVRRFARKMGDRLEPVLVLAEADRRAQRPGSGREPFHLRERIARLRMESALVPELPVDGRDIMAILGLSEGPWVGRAKEFLSEEALKRGHSLSRDEAERLLLGWGASALTARP